MKEKFDVMHGFVIVMGGIVVDICRVTTQAYGRKIAIFSRSHLPVSKTVSEEVSSKILTLASWLGRELKPNTRWINSLKAWLFIKRVASASSS